MQINFQIFDDPAETSRAVAELIKEKTQIISDLGITFYNKSYNKAVSIIKEEAERWMS